MKRQVNGSVKPSVSAASHNRKRLQGPTARPNNGKMQQVYARRDSSSNSETGSNSEQDEDSNLSSDSESDEPDVDGARIVQWEAEDEDENISSLERDVDNGEGSSKHTRKMSGTSLSSFSYGSLLKARQVLQQARVNSDSDDSESEDGAADLEKPTNFGTDDTRGYDQEGSKPNKPEKRAHKHAPVEMTSKRQVTRRRQVVEVKKVTARDPRFSPLAGTENPGVLQKHYSFLADMHNKEYETMKGNVKRARNMLRSSPRDQREAREEELERLERAFKRAESLVNRDKREAIERQALEQTRKQEKERRKEGKGNWYLKKSEKKDLLLKARHDALAETGGRFAVRKAIEKRQKKISQKEKKQRPSFTGRPGLREDFEDRKSNKRQKRTS